MVDEGVLIDAYLKDSIFSDGWNQTLDGFTDVCFSIPDDTNTSNEYHVYLTYDYDDDSWSGYFAYWTPNDGLPVDNAKDPSDKFPSEDGGLLENNGIPVAFNGNYIAFVKLKAAVETFVALCESRSLLRLMSGKGAVMKCYEAQEGKPVFYSLELSVEDNYEFKSLCADAMHSYSSTPDKITLEVSKDGTLFQFTAVDEWHVNDSSVTHMYINPQQDRIELRKWLDVFNLRPD